jgi:PKD repeat protein
MAKARILAVVIIGVLLLSALVPGIAVADPPDAVDNRAPYNGADNVTLMPTLVWENYTDTDGQLSAWWQISTDNAFSNLVWDTGITTDSLNNLEIPRGYLLPETTYYWRVMVQDVLYYWSDWSVATSFTTVKGFCPDQPENVSPANGATEISPDQKLRASDYYDGEGDAHLASQWQVASTAGAYISPLFDSSISTSNKVEIAMPVGLVEYGKTYYWRVRYQDDTGWWSAWSEETSFTVVGNSPPSSPRNVGPLDGAEDVVATAVLTATDFSDPDATAYIALTDSHAASQWQVRSSTGTYDSSPVWDSGAVGPTTSVTVPKGELLAGTPYYWHVRYQDSRGNWSGYSEETSFTTKSISVPVASFLADKTDVVAGRDLVTFTDNSTPAIEIDSWSWDFGDDTTESWTYDTRPPNGKVSHEYTEGGTYTVTLTVYNGARPAGVVDTVEIVVHASPVASFAVTTAVPKAGKEITFKDTSSATDDIQSWEWQFDDGTTETWTTRPENGQITHVFNKGDEHTVSLTVKGKGDLGESFYNKKINVKGAGGFQFGLWMIAVGVGVVVVIAGAVYLFRARKGK